MGIKVKYVDNEKELNICFSIRRKVFIEAIVQEIKECRIDASDWIIDTIFIGGGTPSLLSENMIESLLSQLHKKYDLSNIREITIEANPGEAPKDRLKSFYKMGINRVSIGVQSFQPNLLQFLTRIHNRDQIFETYDNARDAGFDNINCDLIYSIPGQTWSNWSDDLDTISAMSPEHISAYTLTAEKGTELFSMVLNGKLKMPKKEQEGKWFLKTHEILSRNGYQAYEISFISKPFFILNPNPTYWNIEPYLAFGPSAHGFEPEFTAKIAKENLIIYELPISYYGRTYDDGKKITWKDGFAAIFHILRYNLTLKSSFYILFFLSFLTYFIVRLL